MLCENIFCVYQTKGKCNLDEISLDIQGNCTACVYVDIDEKTLKNKKQEFLAEGITRVL